MKRTTLFFLFAGLLLAGPPDEESSIEGQVVNAATGEAVKKATLMLAGANAVAMPRSIESDDDGHFVFQDLEPGRYTLAARRAGFAQQVYGGHGSLLSGTSLTVAAGQALTGIEFKLVPQGVITGHVVDENGELMSNVMVMALHPVYQRGKKQYLPLGSGQVNDLGEFRIAGLGPGRYILSAVYRNITDVIVGSGGGAASADKPDLAVVTTYYPRSADIASAVPVNVPAGGEVPGTDIWMVKAETFRVSGKVVGLEAGGNAIGMLIPKGQGLTGLASGNLAALRGPEGAFTFRAVKPGSYVLRATARLDLGSRGASMPVEVTDHHVEGLVLTMGTGVEVPGVVTVEASDEAPDLKGAQVMLEPTEMENTDVPLAQVSEDGSFTLKAVGAGLYDVRLIRGPKTAYIASVKFGSQDASGGLDLTGGVSETLEIKLSLAGAHVSGVVLGEDDKPYTGAAVALIPDSKRYTLYQSAPTDQNGAFDFQGVTPGDYKLLAWEDIEQGAFMDPDFVKPFESKAEKLSLKENDQRSFSLHALRQED